MRKLLLLAILVGLAAFGGVHGYLWYKVKSSADDFVRSAGAFAEVSYGGIHTSLGGEVGLKKLLIRPHGLDDEVRIEAITLQAADLRALLGAGRELEAGKLPERMSLSLQGLQISMTGAIAELLDSAASDQPRSAFTALEGCGDRSIGPNELVQMGYTRLVSDSRLSYRKLSDRRLVLNLIGDTRELATVELELAIEVDGGLDGDVRRLLGGEPKLNRLQARYSDHGYNRALGAFCAERLKITPEQFVERQTEAVHGVLAVFGLSADEALTAALPQLFSADSEARLVLAPNQPLAVAELQFYQPAQIVRLLQPELTINRTPVELASLAVSSPQQRQPAAASKAAAATVATAPAAATAQPRGYRAVEVTELADHVGWPVRMKLRSGRELEGTLESTAKQAAVIRRRFASGSMSQPVAFADILEAAVLRP